MLTLVRWRPLLTRIIISFGCVGLFMHYAEKVEQQAVINASGIIIGLAGTLLGFLITSMSLITALMDRKLILNMIKTGHYKRLMSDTVLTCTFMLLVIVFCLITLLSSGYFIVWVFYIALFFTSLSLLYLVEAGSRFSAIILNLK